MYAPIALYKPVWTLSFVLGSTRYLNLVVAIRDAKIG